MLTSPPIRIWPVAAAVLGVLGAWALTAGCGYHVAGRADLLPKNIHTIAVPAFGNLTTRYKLGDRLSSAITREFISRTRYQIVADPGEADAILQGTVVSFDAYPAVSDTQTGRATGILVIVTLDLRLTEKNTGAVLYYQPSLQYRERYEISVDPAAYFEESDTAMERLSREVARSVVSAVLEQF